MFQVQGLLWLFALLAQLRLALAFRLDLEGEERMINSNVKNRGINNNNNNNMIRSLGNVDMFRHVDRVTLESDILDLEFEKPGHTLVEGVRRYRRNVRGTTGNSSLAIATSTAAASKRTKKRRSKFTSGLYTMPPYSSLVIFSPGCTGFLISDQHVLTAAHCVHDGSRVKTGARMQHLRVGLYNRKGRLYWIRVRQVMISRRLRPDKHIRLQYDYAVLKLARKHTNPVMTILAENENVDYINYYPMQLNPTKPEHPAKLWCPVFHSTPTSFLLKGSDCMSQPGFSGSPVIQSDWAKHGRGVVGLLSARAIFAKFPEAVFHITVMKRFTQADVDNIKYWQTF